MKKQIRPLLALSLALLLLPALFSGCGRKADSAADLGTQAAPGESYTAEATDDTAQETPQAPTDAALTTGVDTDGAQPAADFTQKIIYSANLDIETTAFDQAVEAVERLVSAFGGFVEQSEVSGQASRQPDGTTKVVDRYATYTLRVPSAGFQNAMHQAGAIGNVTSSNTSAENVTSQYIDQEARRNSLEIQETRLLAMLEKSEDVETLVELESRLSEVRYEIESIERTLRNWQARVDYSTIHIRLTEVAVYTPTAAVQRTFGEKLTDALSGGWSGFVHGLQGLTIGLASGLPVLLLLALAAVAAFRIVRRVRRRRNPPQTQEDSHADDKES